MVGQKVAVLFSSKYGSTEKYARWIAEAVEADLFPMPNVPWDKLDQYDAVVYGGGLYASGINGVSVLKNRWATIRAKPVLIFAVGASPPRPEVVHEVLQANFPPEMREEVAFFMLRGAFDMARLGLVDKGLMYFWRWKLTRKPPEERSDDERGMLSVYERPVDWTRREAAQPLVERILAMTR